MKVEGLIKTTLRLMSAREMKRNRRAKQKAKKINELILRLEEENKAEGKNANPKT